MITWSRVVENIDRNDGAVDREVLGIQVKIVIGTGCEVAVGFVHDFDAYFRIGVLGAKWDRVHSCLRRIPCVFREGISKGA